LLIEWIIHEIDKRSVCAEYSNKLIKYLLKQWLNEKRNLMEEENLFSVEINKSKESELKRKWDKLFDGWSFHISKTKRVRT